MDLGVIVAGGAGTRLGGDVPKSEAVLGGETLLARALATLAAACDRVVVVTPRARRPAWFGSAPATEITRATWIEDAPGGEGPLAGVVAGLGAESYDRAIVLGVDFPLVRPAFLRALLAELDTSRTAAVVPAPGGVPQPLVAAYAPRAAFALAGAFARGERAVTRAALTLSPMLLGDEHLTTLDGGLENLFNVNTRDDLEQAERRLG